MALPLVSRDPILRERIERQVAERFAKAGDPWTAELTLMQKIALLKMNNSSLSRGVAKRLIADEAFDAHPSYGDYLALAAVQLCERPHGSQWHQLTTIGAIRADTITRDECKRLGIHILIYPSRALIGGNASFRCSCGGWSTSIRAGMYTEGNATRAFGRHMEAVEASA